MESSLWRRSEQFGGQQTVWESITTIVNNLSLQFKVWNLHQLEQKGSLMEEGWHPTKPRTLALEMHHEMRLASSWCKQESCLKNLLPIPSWGGNSQCCWLQGDTEWDVKLDLALQGLMAPTVQQSLNYISNCEMGEHWSRSPRTSEVNEQQSQSSDLGFVVFIQLE